MSYKYLKKKNNKGFTLIELSIVLVIIGLMLTVAVGLMTSLTQTSRIAKERKQLQTIENSLIAYALSRGRLPDALGGGTQGSLDYMALDLSTAYKDSWGQPYQYAVSDVLTRINAQNFCVVLYQLQNLHSWGIDSCNSNSAVCVTSTDDVSDNGRIVSQDEGYHIAAYIFSRGEDRESGGKNSNANFEYEMASNRFDVDAGRDDLVQELTFAELSTKICHARNTRIRVNFNIANVYWSESDCQSLTNQLTSLVDVAIGQNLWFNRNGHCAEITFGNLARCDATGNFNPSITGISCVNDPQLDTFNAEVTLQ